MEADKFFVSLITFIFLIFLFPTMNNAIANATVTSNIAPVIQAFPYVFLMFSLVFVIYFGVKESR